MPKWLMVERELDALVELSILFIRAKRAVIGRVRRRLFLNASRIEMVNGGLWLRSEQI